MLTVLAIVVGLVALVAGYVVVTYNGLVRLRNLVEEGWSGIETQMKRRYDLIPNLVETVKGYAKHEKSTLESVIEKRNAAAANTGSPARQAAGEIELGVALRGLFALAESYPDLKANETFQTLQTELAETEDQIQLARRYYNGTVRNLNVKIEQFPSNLIAQRYGFTQAEFFELDEADEAARDPVKVSF